MFLWISGLETSSHSQKFLSDCKRRCVIENADVYNKGVWIGNGQDLFKKYPSIISANRIEN